MQHQVGVGGSRDGAFDADRFDLAGAGPDSCRVRQPDFCAVQVEQQLDEIARGARLVRDDSGIAPSQCVQKAGFPGVRRADNDDVKAFADHLRLAVAGDMRPDLVQQHPCIFPDRIGDRTRNVRLVGEIQIGLDHRAGMDQASSPFQI